MYGSEVAEAFNAVLHALIYDDALLEEVAALHDAVSHGIDFIEAFDCAYLAVEQALEHEIDAFLMVGHVVHDFLFLAVGQSHFDESLIKTDTLNAAGSEH